MFTSLIYLIFKKNATIMENLSIYIDYLITVRNDFYNKGFIKQAEKVQNDINKMLQENQK